jgi:hypothetical protein
MGAPPLEDPVVGRSAAVLAAEFIHHGGTESTEKLKNKK